jgi:nucleotide-binding universal stress UspA family protein
MSSDRNSSYVKNTREDYSTEPTDVEYSISKSSIPSFSRILVSDDGKEIST